MSTSPTAARRLLALARTLLLIAVAGGATLFGLRWWTDQRAKPLTYTAEAVPPRAVAVVFGAGIWPDGRLSAILQDRVETAVELYHLGKVRKILMTGDNSRVEYNEPQRMREYALSRGVPDEDIVLDYAGRRTYDSCYRAVHIFCLEEAILVTQAYHLDRALFTAGALGLDVVGVPADRQGYSLIVRYWWRELLATPVAWWQAVVAHPRPILGEPLPIDL